MTDAPTHGAMPDWKPGRPRLRPFALVVTWLVSALALLLAARIVPGASVSDWWATILAALAIAALNAILPPLVAALRLPFMLLVGFLLVLVLDALMLLAASSLISGLEIDDFWSALGVAIVAAAIGVAFDVLLGTDDDDAYSLRVVQRIARRSGGRTVTDEPGIVFLEIDGLGLPILQRAMRDGSAPTMARWLADGSHHLNEWETDLSSQTGASQAGILLGSNDDIPAFRWVEKESSTLMQCSSAPQCAELERRHSTGVGLLVNGGASRGNLFSGEADHVILTVSRLDAEKRANPGYRAFLANGFNVVRTLTLVFWEVILEVIASSRAKRRDIRPRGARGGKYPFVRGGLCVFVRDLIVYGVLSDMMNGRPAIYATFSSYDEVAHHSGLERADTMEALRKLDRQFARIERARPYAARPYEIVVLSDHGQTQGATFKQRNGYGLEDLVTRSLSGGTAAGIGGADEQNAMVGHALSEATGGRADGGKKVDVPLAERRAVVLGSGNLGLVYLMDEQYRLSREEIDKLHPELLPALRAHEHIGWLLVHSSERGPLVLGRDGEIDLATGEVTGESPLAHLSPTASRHLLRADGFTHVADIMVGSFYDPALEEGCAFEELISFHGGLGGPQTRPFVLHPATLAFPAEPVIGAESLHDVLAGWRRELTGAPYPPPREGREAELVA